MPHPHVLQFGEAHCPVVGRQFRVTGQVYRIQIGKFGQHSLRQFPADAATLIVGEHLEPREEGGRQSVADGIDEPDHRRFAF
jgi:hypothetical protein